MAVDVEIAPLGTDQDDRFGWLPSVMEREPVDGAAYLVGCFGGCDPAEWAMQTPFADASECDEWVEWHERATGHAAHRITALARTGRL